MTGNRSLQRAMYCAFIFLLAFAPIGYSQPVVAGPILYRYANGVTLAAGSPLPIYKITTPVVTKESTQTLTQVFSSIFTDTLKLGEDNPLGYSRFTGLNVDNHTILEQFGATGGFYAYAPERAFGDGSVVPSPDLDPARAQALSCQFIALNQKTLGPTTDDLQIPGLDTNCVHDFVKQPLYRTSTETRSGQGAAAGSKTTNTPLRVMVTVPVLVNTGKHSQVAAVPLGGPGGHISMLFDTTAGAPKDPKDSLDSHIPGLQAVAMPAFGRSLTFSRTVPAADPAEAANQVLRQVRAAFPGGTNIQIPDPDLVYYLSDAAQPQSTLEPNLVFSGVSVDVDGQTQFLKDIVLPGAAPGAGGLGPTVKILSPLSGAVNFSGKTLELKGQVSDGVPPYTYEWQVDYSSALGGGVLNAPGALPALTKTLPNPESKGAPGGVTIYLTVTDGEGITRQQAVSLVVPAPMYLPVIGNLATSGSAAPERAPSPAGAPAAGIVPMAINYRFGVEYGSDYPPYGPGGSDLGAVPPDANGFSTGLMGLGWPRTFNWYNANAWEKDWRDCSLGGLDCTYGVDRTDFVYYAGHGSAGGIAMPSNSHDSSWFDGANARYQRARWVAFSSCQTLRAQWPTAGAEPIRRWFNAFQGAHMLLGFNSNMADVAYGPRFVDNMRLPSFLGIEFPWAQRTIAQAWVQTAFQMNAGKPAYIYATSASVNPIGNKLPKVSDPLLPRPNPVNGYYWVWWNE